MQHTKLYLLRLISPARSWVVPETINRLVQRSKPETPVHAEQWDIRERAGYEPIHLRRHGSTICACCGRHAAVWTDNEHNFSNNPNRCGNLPPVEVSLV